MLQSIEMNLKLFGRYSITFRSMFFMLCIVYVAFMLVILSSMDRSVVELNNNEVRKMNSKYKANDDFTERQEFNKLVSKLQGHSKFGNFIFRWIDSSLKAYESPTILRSIDENKKAIADLDFENKQLHKQMQRMVNKVINQVQANTRSIKLLRNELQKKNQSASAASREDFAQPNIFVTKDMARIHDRVLNKMNKEELTVYFKRERETYDLYAGKVLDPIKDRDLLMGLFPSPDEKSDRMIEQLSVKLNVKDEKLIYVKSSEDVRDLRDKFRSDKCSVDKCRFTDDSKRIKDADVVYSWFKMWPELLAQRRDEQQIFIVYQLESPQYFSNVSLASVNWTATFRRDSVLNTPYDRFTPHRNVTELPAKPLRNYAHGKTKMVAGFMSNCIIDFNGRLQYIKELQKYTYVDIYGECGQLRCQKKDKSCMDRLNTDYKFYLAFENSNCKDYVTEKFFKNGLQHDIIPIVMGAHPEDYKNMAPPNSYIHVDDFESPKQLAEYLNFLDQNDEYYNQYFLWKQTGYYVNTKFLCRLCTMAHLAPHFPMWYSEPVEWWSGNGVCLPPLRFGHTDYTSWSNSGSKRGKTTIEYPNYVKYGYDRVN